MRATVIDADTILVRHDDTAVVFASDIAPGGFSLINSGTILSEAPNRALALLSYSPLILDNHGSIGAVTAGSGDAFGVWGTTFSTIVNDGVVYAEANLGDAFAILANAGLDNYTLTNTGRIRAFSDAGFAIAVQIRNRGDVLNENLIFAEGGDGAIGVDFTAQAQSTLVNTGTIVAIAGENATNHAVGVSLDGGGLRNEGTISAEIAVLISDDYNGSASSEIDNSGLFEGTILQLHNGNQAARFGLTISNSGTINGSILLDAAAANANTITNSGEILGNVRLGAGNDTFVGKAGSVTGIIYGLGGDDRLIGGGNDTAGFVGRSDDYEAHMNADGGFTVIDLKSAVGSGDGIDSIAGITALYFAGDDKTITLSDFSVHAAEFQLLAPDGLVVAVGENGAVFGTTGFQNVTVLDLTGDVSFDPSFNRGGDVIRLSGNARAWIVGRDGSNAVLNDGDTRIFVPIGASATHIVFDDGARDLRIDTVTGRAVISNQNLEVYLQPLNADAQRETWLNGADRSASGKLVFMADGSATIAGDIAVFGTVGAEQLRVVGGTVTLDPSFNRGGDTLVLDVLPNEVTAVRFGSSVMLTSSEFAITMPVGPTGSTIEFANDDSSVLYDIAAGNLLIGDQVIGFDPIVLHATF